MGRRSRKSKRRMNSLFMALLLTAVMLIMSTYAWFSANRVVEIKGITAKVSAAEGLQISLDAKTWSSSVTVNETELQKVKTYNNYNLPEELHPVSTTGATSSGEVSFYQGLVSADGTQLTGAGAASATNDYIVFDIYLKNSSSRTEDDLQLAPNTEVKLGATTGKEGVQNTGLENSVRVGLSLFSTTATFTTAQADIAKLAPGTPLVAIWEPNYNKHIAEVVTNDTRLGGNASSDFKTFGLLNSGTGTLTGINGTAATDFMAETNTIRTDAKITSETPPVKLTSAAAAGEGASAQPAGTQLKLPGNAISKARVYIWLEGQDPDCIDTASTGKYLDFVLNLSKPAVTTSTPTPTPGG